jgi:hypothetical protein
MSFSIDESKFTAGFGLEIIENMFQQLQEDAEANAEEFGGEPDVVFTPHENYSGSNTADSGNVVMTKELKLAKHFLSDCFHWRNLDWTEYK